MRALKTIREVVHAYKKAARLYDLMNLLYFFGRDKRFASMLVEKLTPDVNDTALNLCCGTGLDFPFLLKKTKKQGNAAGNRRFFRDVATGKEESQKCKCTKLDNVRCCSLAIAR